MQASAFRYICKKKPVNNLENCNTKNLDNPIYDLFPLPIRFRAAQRLLDNKNIPIKPTGSTDLALEFLTMVSKHSISFLAIVIALSCTTYRKNQQNNQRVLKTIYETQKDYVNSSIDNKLDFKPIIDFASKGRGNLYRTNGFFIDRPTKYILLEGFVNNNGQYAGVILFDDVAIAYANSEKSSWRFLRFDKQNSDSLQLATGINQAIISRVAAWDTAYIKGLKHAVGSVVLDGFSFIASKIDNTNKSLPLLQTVAFYGFP